METQILYDKRQTEGKKLQIQATVINTINSPKRTMIPYINKFNKLKNDKRSRISEFLDWIVDQIPKNATYKVVKGEVVFSHLPEIDAKAKGSKQCEKQLEIQF